jgi:hypothetical protein
MSDDDRMENSETKEANETGVTNESSNHDVLEVSNEPGHALESAPKQGRNTFNIAIIGIAVLAVLVILWASTANKGADNQSISAGGTSANDQSATIPTQGTNNVAQTPQAQEPASNEPPFIEPQEVLDLYNAQNVLIVDVRAPEAYKESHVKDAVSIPEAEVATRLREFPKTGNLVLYCT